MGGGAAASRDAMGVGWGQARARRVRVCARTGGGRGFEGGAAKNAKSNKPNKKGKRKTQANRLEKCGVRMADVGCGFVCVSMEGCGCERSD